MKEAYEFYILNPFLINEEDLHTLLAEVVREENVNHNSGFKYSSAHTVPLELHNHNDSEESSEEEGKAKLVIRKRQKKSLMNVDLERMAAEALSKGEQQFSFNNNQIGGGEMQNASRKD